MFVTKEQMNGVVDLFQLTENNSGAISHKGYLKTFDNVRNKFIDHVKKLDSSDFTQNLTKSERTIKCEVKWMSCPSIIIPSYPISSNISIVLLPIYKDTNRITFSANLSNDENHGYIINIQVNSIKRVSDLLSNKGMDEIEGIIGHELTHLFKSLHGEYQKTGIDLFDKKKNSINHKKYFSDSGEIDAHITQMNMNLTNIKLRKKNIIFKSALLLNEPFKNYIKNLNVSFGIKTRNVLFISKKDPTSKIKKYILKKLLNHWKEDLDGKI